MQWGYCLGVVTWRSSWRIENKCVFIIGPNLLMDIQKKFICPKFHEKHMKVCHGYKNATTLASTKVKYQGIHVWWLSSSATFENNIHELNDWLAFWDFCYLQWRGYDRIVSFLLFLLIVQLSLIFHISSCYEIAFFQNVI